MWDAPLKFQFITWAEGEIENRPYKINFQCYWGFNFIEGGSFICKLPPLKSHLPLLQRSLFTTRQQKIAANLRMWNEMSKCLKRLTWLLPFFRPPRTQTYDAWHRGIQLQKINPNWKSWILKNVAAFPIKILRRESPKKPKMEMLCG